MRTTTARNSPSTSTRLVNALGWLPIDLPRETWVQLSRTRPARGKQAQHSVTAAPFAGFVDDDDDGDMCVCAW